MSFTFENDLQGTVTKVRENGDAMVEASAASATFGPESCKMKKFLSAINAKGIKVCKDLQILDGDLFLGSGVSDKSIVKEVSLVFGTHIDGDSGSGDAGFTSIDPDLAGINELGDSADADLVEDAVVPGSDDPSAPLAQTLEDSSAIASQTEGKWYLRFVRPNQQVHFVAFKPLNDLMIAAQLDGNVRSLLEGMNELEELRATLDQIFVANAYASEQDIDALELLIDKDIIVLSDALDALELRLKNHVEAGDLALRTAAQNDLNASMVRLQHFYNGAALSATAPLVTNAACELDQADNEVLGIINVESDVDVKHMLLDVRVVEGTGESAILRKDIELAWTAVYGGKDGSVSEGEDDQLKILYSAQQCGDLDGDLYISICAIDCSAQARYTASFTGHQAPSYSDVVGPELQINSGTRDSDAGGQNLVFAAGGGMGSPDSPVDDSTTPPSPPMMGYFLVDNYEPSDTSYWSGGDTITINYTTYDYDSSESLAVKVLLEDLSHSMVEIQTQSVVGNGSHTIYVTLPGDFLAADYNSIQLEINGMSTTVASFGSGGGFDSPDSPDSGYGSDPQIYSPTWYDGTDTPIYTKSGLGLGDTLKFSYEPEGFSGAPWEIIVVDPYNVPQKIQASGVIGSDWMSETITMTLNVDPNAGYGPIQFKIDGVVYSELN